VVPEDDTTSEYSRFLKGSKYATNCKLCNAIIRLGEPCYWRPAGDGGVVCVKCKTGKSAPPLPKPIGVQGEWYKLVSCLRDLVLVGSTADLMTPEEIGGVQIIRFAGILNENAKEVAPVGSGVVLAKKRFDRREEGPLSFGWPILAFTDALGIRKCAPMFVATITLELSSNDQVILTRESSFSFNPALTASDGLGLALSQELELLNDDVAQTVVTELVADVATKLDIPLHGFDQPSVEMGENVKEGIYNSATLMAGDSAATANLIKELDRLRDRDDWQQTAAACLVTGLTRAVPSPKSSLPMVAPLTINHNQELILKKSATAGTMVVTGPPGTGKSQIVVDLVANSLTHGETVLVTSTNNAAVDVASTRAHAVVPGLLIRTGNKSAREALPDLVAQLISAATEVDQVDRASMEANLFRATKERDGFLLALKRCAELENLHHGQLQIEEELGSEVRVFGTVDVSDETAPDVLKRAQRCSGRKFLRSYRWKKLAKKYQLARAVASISPTLKWLTLRVENLDRQQEILQLRTIIGDVGKRSHEIDDHWRTSSIALTRAVVSDSIARNKSRFSTLAQARASYYGMLKAIETVMPFLKGWACTTLSLHQNFPLDPGYFDVVVVDEASQCHLAYILPAAFRAKRLILVGDPNQLPPIVNVSPEQEISIAMRNGVSAAELTRRRLSSNIYSAYDFFANVVGDANVDLLNEHYRSHPRIARWFNETFYGSALTVLTDISSSAGGSRSLSWIDAPGTASQPAKGSWVNDAEAREVMMVLEEYLTSGKTVGVVTPFSAQARHIGEMALRQFGRDRLGDLDFRSGTAHSFQGDERDVMIFSCVLADGISAGAAKWVQGERRLINVAVSRARETLIVIGNPDIGIFDCPTLTSLHMFSKTVHDFADSRIGPRIDSEAERRLYEAMIDVGLDPISKFDVEGYELDFGIISGELRVDVEVDGDQHYEKTVGNHLRLRRQDISRDAVLARAGWLVKRVPAWECIQHAAVLAAEIVALMSVEITPSTIQETN
jgi:very-short-patch-repair endonuclease